MTKNEMIKRYIKGHKEATIGNRCNEVLLERQLKRYTKATLQMMLDREGY